MPGLIFLGTPDFAVPSLRKLLEQKAGVNLVIAQPDRPSGRGRKISESPVKKLAIDAGIPVYQPERISGNEIIEKIRTYGGECAVVVAFGQILPQEFLDIFPYGTLNVHGSVLPRYRGAAPVQRAILAGDAGAGVSIMLLDAGMDSGPVLSQKEIAIGPEDAFGIVYNNLAEVGADLLVETLRDWTAGRIRASAQDESMVTFAPAIRKEELRIDWNSEAKNIINKIRAFDPAPGAWFSLEGKRVKCFKARSFSLPAAEVPGEVVGISDCGLIVAGSLGQPLCIGELQMEGFRRISASEFIRGRPIPRGSILQ